VSGVEFAVLLVDLHDRSVRARHEQGSTPLLIDDLSFGRKAGRAKPALDGLERLIGDEV